MPRPRFIARQDLQQFRMKLAETYGMKLAETFGGKWLRWKVVNMDHQKLMTVLQF